MLADFKQQSYSYEFKIGFNTDTLQLLTQSPNEILDLVFENDCDNPFLLKKTGFTMDMQLLRWVTKNKDALISGKSQKLAVSEFIDETIQDVIGFYYEYLSDQDIFPIHVEIQSNENGQRDVIATKYNQPLRDINKNFEALTGQNEREGALQEGVDKAIDIILNSGPNTIVILNSPSGWSGIKRNGKEITYPDNQTYCYFINMDGDLDALTIRTDISLQEGEKLVKVTDTDFIFEKDRLKKVVSNPISFQGNSFEDVLNRIEEVSGKKFGKVRTEIQNRKKLFSLNEDAQKIVDDLSIFLKNNIGDLNLQNVKLFVENVGRSILDLANLTLNNKTTEKVRYVPQIIGEVNINPQIENYNEVLSKVQQRKGCNGGGVSVSNSVFGPRSYTTSESGLPNKDNECCYCHTTIGVSCGWCKLCWELFGDK